MAARRSCACGSVLLGLSPSSPSPGRHLDRRVDPNTRPDRSGARGDAAAGTLGQRGSRAATMKRRPADSGSSPVSSRNAIGICRRRRTPSFCRSTSQCAFAVLGEIPRRIPTSSFEQPAAINATTSRCLNVMGVVFLSVASSIMATKLLPRSRDGHWLGGVRRGVTGVYALPSAPEHADGHTSHGMAAMNPSSSNRPSGTQGRPRVRGSDRGRCGSRRRGAHRTAATRPHP